MPKLSVKPCIKKHMSMSVYIDDEFAFNVDKEWYYKSILYGIDKISNEDLEKAFVQFQFMEARKVAVNSIVSKMQSEYSIKNKLISKGYAHDIADKVINELISIGYINDLMYAKKYVKSKMSLRPVTKRHLQMQLSKNGIDSKYIEEALSEINTDELSLAIDLIKKKFKNIPNNDQEKEKAARFLKNRGFCINIIMQVLFDTSTEEIIQ